MPNKEEQIEQRRWSHIGGAIGARGATRERGPISETIVHIYTIVFKAKLASKRENT